MTSVAKRWPHLLGGLAVLWVIGFFVLAPLLVPVLVTNRNVPPNLRADRWELSRDGDMARQRTIEICGELTGDAWIDLPETAAQPVLLSASAERTACFNEKIAPRFQRGRPAGI
jgi:hypothetical protein